MRRIMIAAAAALTIGACAPMTEQASSSYQERSSTTLVVRNNNWMDVTVYLISGAHRTRLGSVTALSKHEFQIPEAYILGNGDVTLQADPVGSRETFVSPPIQVFSGALVELTVANALRHSNYAVFARGR